MAPSLFLTGKIMGSRLKYKMERNIHDGKCSHPGVFCIGEKQLAMDMAAHGLCWLLGFSQISLKDTGLGRSPLKCLFGTYTQRGNVEQGGKYCVALAGLRKWHAFQKCHSGRQWEMRYYHWFFWKMWKGFDSCAWLCLCDFECIFSVHIWKQPYSDIISESNLEFAMHFRSFVSLGWSWEMSSH